jgi:hypothetical protein
MNRRRFLVALPGAAAFAARGEASCDVLIAGASLGGVAAALAAADMGRTVVMTEETAWIGGQATTQGVPLDEHPWIEERGRNRSYAEFRTRVRDYYRRNYPLSEAAKRDPIFNPGACWVSRCGFEPRAGLAALHSMLARHLSAGRVRILTRTRPVAVEMSGDRCRAVTFASSDGGGRVTVAAPFVLDATEEGDLLPLARMEFVTGAESQSQTGEPSALEGAADPLRMQPITHLLALDYLPGEDHRIEKPAGYERWKAGFKSLVGVAEAKDDELQLRMRRLFAPQPSQQYASSIWNFRRVLCASNFARGAFRSDVTMLMNGNEYHGGPIHGVPDEVARRRREEAKELSLSALYFFQNEAEPGYDGRAGFPGLRARGDVFGASDGLAQCPYIRESRRIRAEFTAVEQHFRVEQHPDAPVLYKDSVGVSGYRIDIHEKARSGASRTWDLHGKHWTQQIPLGALIPVRVENVLAACKNLGATHVTNGAYRVHPAEWGIGEAAGALAAFCLDRKLTPRQVRNTQRRLEEYQRVLTARGVELKWEKPEIAKSYNSVYATVPGWHFGEAERQK